MSAMYTSAHEWSTIHWAKAERVVFKLQKRIYRAKSRGDVKAVRRLQRLLVKSRSAKLLATRRVTQDNRGKRTAGIDGVKALHPAQRMHLADTLTLPAKASPTRRVWIPKPGTTERRPLGIPTMRDRAAQALLKLALEPEWEAAFEPNSYGFRPGRSSQDAIEAIHHVITFKPRYVLDADIAKCFDRIDHAALLCKLDTTPTFRRAVRAWLKAGVMEGPELFPTEEGTPQGGVISPLLANIALHGLETAIVSAFPKTRARTTNREQYRYRQEGWTPYIVRYADDFVVLHQDETVISQAKQVASNWLADMGLELKPSKTRVAHTLYEHNGEQPGFDFLGFRIRQFPVGKRHTGTNRFGTPLGYKSITRPSPESQTRQRGHLRTLIRAHTGFSQDTVVGKLNPVITGWSHYYRSSAASRVFDKMDRVVWEQLWAWARRRHPNKGAYWRAERYWHPDSQAGKWTFHAKGGPVLKKHTDTTIQRHVKVQGNKSPFDGDWGYWAGRMGRHPELSDKVAMLLRRQKGKCPECGLYFKPDDVWETDHRTPTALGGTGKMENLQVIHGHCHDRKTARDGSLARVSVTTDQMAEEPCEVKASSTVL